MDVDDDPALASAFTVESQRLELDFSFCPRLVKGKTAITILVISTQAIVRFAEMDERNISIGCSINTIVVSWVICVI